MAPSFHHASDDANLIVALCQALRDQLAALLEVQSEDIPAHCPFDDLGVTKATAFTFLNRLEATYGSLPPTLLSPHATLEQLAAYLHQNRASSVSSLTGAATQTPCHLTHLSHLTSATRAWMADLAQRFLPDPLTPALDWVAPWRFENAQQRGYFCVSQNARILFAFSYIGEPSALPSLAHDFLDFAKQRGYFGNLITTRMGSSTISATAIAVQPLVELKTFERSPTLDHLLLKVGSSAYVMEEAKLGPGGHLEEAVSSLLEQNRNRAPFDASMHALQAQLKQRCFDPQTRVLVTLLGDQPLALAMIRVLNSQWVILEKGLFSSQASPKVTLVAVLALVEKLRAEGYQSLSLGPMPFVPEAAQPDADPQLQGQIAELNELGLWSQEAALELANLVASSQVVLNLSRLKGEKGCNLEDLLALLNPSDLTSPATPTETPPSPAHHRDSQLKPNADIAIIGMAGRYPLADDLDQFWDNLMTGRDCIRPFPQQRLQDYPDPGQPFTHAVVGGYLDQVDSFDALFFNISPREAQLLDPHERIFLETAWTAMEHAGYAPEGLPSNSGVYVGAVWAHYQFLGHDLTRQGNLIAPNSFLWSIANRVSTVFNIHGPSMAVDTACSASHTAIHLARQSLLCGETELAFAGGISLDLHPLKRRFAEVGRALSKDGRCRAFGAGANGYVAGEGVGVVVLKPLQAAEAAGDSIYGVIKASTLNHGGNASGYTVPNPNAQAALIRNAIKQAGLRSSDIGYVEAHGTGTELGDPIEVRGLTLAFEPCPANSVGLGSVKSNIGHLEPAAGIAGVTKVLLQFAHQMIPPSLHVDELNPHIDLAATPFRIQREATPWRKQAQRRRAGISAFGAGGANAHIILEDYPTRLGSYDGEPEIFVFSARSEERLKLVIQRFVSFLDQAVLPSTHDIAFTLQVGRRTLKYRLAVVAKTIQALETLLMRWLEDGSAEGVACAQGALLEQGLSAVPPGVPITEIAQDWLQGKFRPGTQLSPQRRGQRVALPTYPFERQRHWLPQASETPQVTRAARQYLVAPDHSELVLFRPDWQVQAAGPKLQPQAVLLFDRDESLLAQFQSQSGLRPLLVRPGSAFLRVDEFSFTLDPAQPDQVQQLARILEDEIGVPNYALYLWSWRLPDNSSEQQRLDLGVRFLFFLGRSLRIRRDHPLHLLIPGSNHPEDLAISAFARTLTLEQPGFQIRVAQLESNPVAADALVDLALSEWSSQAVEVRFRDQQRQVRNWAELPVQEGELPLKREGVYLITGGMGGIGLVFAQWLARSYAARLVLAGRSKDSTRFAAKLAQLEAAGAQVRYVAADISQADEVAQLMAEARAQFGRIDGIIHAAGLLHDALIHKKRRIDFEEVLAPKVSGTRLLDQASAADALDFFVLCSSVASVFGNAGQCDYAYANRFMDEFACARQARVESGTRSGISLSINWPLWREGGMTVDEAHEKWMARTMGLYAMPEAQGIEAFRRALCSGAAQVAVFFGEGERIRPYLSPQVSIAHASATQAEPVASDQRALMRPKLEAAWVQLVAELLQIASSEVDVTDQVFDLGFDSLTLADLANLANERFDLDLMPTVFYEFMSVRELSDYLLSEYAEKMRQQFGQPDRAEAQTLAASTRPTLSPTPAPANLPQALPAANVDQIAIIGIGGIFPGSPDTDSLWRHLEAGDDLISEIPKSRWDWQAFWGDPAEPQNRMRARWGSFIEGVDLFDSLYFNIPPREAALMDPQHRIFLETTWATLENAAYAPRSLAGSRTGVFVGIATLDYAEYLQLLGIEADGYLATGNSHCMLPNRISFLLDLHGPSETVDTACSSALLAIHRAVESLHSGDCELAIAGAVNVMLNPLVQVSFDKAGLLSADGRCRSFDKSASGYARGEGSGAVLLKPLGRAQADGDHIHGVILASAIRHAGRSSALTAPNPAGQVKLIVDAWQAAGVSPSTASYLEAHGSGTELGDSIEFNSTCRAFAELERHYGGQPPKSAYCGIGSVRSNIGHLDTVTGMAALFKVLMGMRHRLLPATVHFQEHNPFLRLKDSPFFVVAATRPWEQLSDANGQPIPRRAGINSFSFGGLNAHLVVEEWAKPTPASASRAQLLVLSARSEERLRAYAAKLAAFLDSAFEQLDLAQVAYSLQVGRDPLPYRLALAVNSLQEARTKLADYGSGQEVAGLCLGQVSKKKSDTALLFEGPQGPNFIRAIIADQDLPRLAMLFTQGVELPWTELHPGSAPRRCPLPTYPFARIRHWVDAPPDFVWGQHSTGAATLPLPAPALINTEISAAPDANASPKQILIQTLTQLLANFLQMAVEDIDLEADLSDYGLNSFSGGRLAMQLREQFQFDIPLSALYEYPNISELADFLIDHIPPERLVPTRAEDLASTPAQAELTQFPPSDAQRALWFIHNMQPQTTAWHLPIVLKLYGELKLKALERAIEHMALRHQAPRTRFVRQGNELIQTVDLPAPPLQHGDVSGLGPAELKERISQIAFAPFALDEALFRCFLLKCNQDHLLLIVTHHIIMDGSSFAVMLNEINSLYTAFYKGQQPQLHAPVPFSDFVSSQHARLASDQGTFLRDWWCQQLGDGVPVLDLPRDGHAGETEMMILQTSLNTSQTQAGRALAMQGRASMFMVMLAAFKLLLARYSGQDDFAVGTPYANRNELRFQEVMGYFINMLPIRARLSRQESSLKAIERTKKAVLGALDHGEFPFSRLVEALDLGRESFPLFHVCIVYQSELGDVDQDVFSTDTRSEDPAQLNMQLEHIVHERGGFDLTLEIFEFPDHCDLFFKYNAARYSNERIRELAHHFEVLLGEMAAQPQRPVAWLNFIDVEEREALLYPVGYREPPLLACAHDLIAQQAQREPDAIAVVCGSQSLTYRELDQRANQVAWRLRRAGVGPEHYVGLCLDRSLELAVGLLGILKAGGSYLPIDPHYPEERKQLMLEEAKVKVVLTQRHHAARFATCGAHVLCLDSQWGLFARESSADPQLDVALDCAAYLIFTSGSTGRPKGVPVTHGALVNYATTFAACYHLDAADRVLQFASISFDTAVEEIFPTWIMGARLVFRPAEQAIEPRELMKLCTHEGITILDLPTAYWHLWLNDIEDTAASLPSKLRLVIVGGEQVASNRLAQWAERIGDRVVWTNTYGPTEATIAVSHFEWTTLV